MIRLITIPLSHYCEKVRWALQRQGLPFREEGHVPVLHALHTLPTSRWRSRQVPILVDGDTVCVDSASCLRHLHDRYQARWLYPTPEAAALEKELGEQLGPHARRFFYFHCLGDKQRMLAVFSQHVPAHEARLAATLYPVIRKVMTRAMNINPESATRSLAKVVSSFARVGERLQDGRRYLCGDGFSVADLTFATLAAPLVMPAQYWVQLPALDTLPEVLRREIDRFRATAAGDFALRMYSEERHMTLAPPSAT